MISENQMMSMYSSGSQDLEFALDLHKKTIDINFRVKVSAKDDILDLGYYRLQLKLDKLSVVFFEKEADSEYLIIPLDAPPELYRKPARISSIHHKGSRYWLEWDTLIRQTDVVLDEQQLRRQPGGLRRHSAIIDIGMCCSIQ